MKRYLVPALASVVVTFGLWLYTRDSTASLIIGLLTNLTFLVIEHFQIAGKVSKYLETHSGLIDSSDLVVSAARAMRKLENSGTILQRWIAERAFERLNDNLTNISSGRWVVQSVEGFVDLAEKLFERDTCRTEYCGTSVVSDYRAYWTSGLGKRFQDATVNAMKRGVTIKRVFILERPEDKVEAEPVMRAQAALQIDVRYMLRSDAPTGTPTIDFGIWNQSVAVELSESRYQGSAFRATFHLNPIEVKHLMETFEALFNAAVKFEAAGSEHAAPKAKRREL